MQAQLLTIFCQMMPAMLCLALGSKAEASPPGARAAPMDPEAAWAASYLVSTVMVREYEAVLASLDQAQETKVPVGKSPKNKSQKTSALATSDHQNGLSKAFLLSDAGQALWVRGQFGLLSLASRKQSLLDLPKVAAQAEEHTRALASLKVQVPSVEALRRAVDDRSASLSPETEAVFATLSAAFTPLGLKDYWPEVERHFTAADLACVIAPNEVSDAATYIHKLIQETDSEQSTSPVRMLANYATWPPAKIRCLALSLATLPQVTPGEHLAFLMALRQSQGPYAKDTALSALTAQRLIETIRYPEALAILLDLSDQDPSFRLPYELLQRIFSARQKGRGAVALQGL